MRIDTALCDRLASAALQKIKQFDLCIVENEMAKIYVSKQPCSPKSL